MLVVCDVGVDGGMYMETMLLLLLLLLLRVEIQALVGAGKVQEIAKRNSTVFRQRFPIIFVVLYTVG
jgi:hypothetical protein